MSVEDFLKKPALYLLRLIAGMIIMFVVWANLSSCTNNRFPKNGDGGFITGEPCAPPCFEGMVPGITREADVIQILIEHDVYNTCTRTEFQEETKGTEELGGLLCSRFLAFTFEPRTNLLTQIGFNTAGHLTIEETITKHGKPDSVWVWLEGSPDQPVVGMKLYYNEMRTILSLPTTQRDKYIVDTSTPINRIIYLNQYYYDTALSDHEIEGLMEWYGYGEYEAVVDFRPP